MTGACVGAWVQEQSLELAQAVRCIVGFWVELGLLPRALLRPAEYVRVQFRATAHFFPYEPLSTPSDHAHRQSSQRERSERAVRRWWALERG